MKGPKWRQSGELQSGRGARRGITRKFYGRRKRFCEKFETVDDGNDGQVQRLRSNGRAGRRAKLAGMRAAGHGVEIGAKVELRGQEDHAEQQSANAGPMGVAKHLSNKTKLRLEWLRGQATEWGWGQLSTPKAAGPASKVLG